MDVEKRDSKGGFLQLFDWNIKSRKRLFSNNSELPEDLKNVKDNFANSKASQFQLMDVHENGSGSKGKGKGDYEFASSLGGDEGYGTRAPSVVARLMGLDSLPVSTSTEPTSTSVSDPALIRDSHTQRSMTNFQIEHHIVYDNDVPSMVSHPMESRLQRVQSRSIERFQLEILPPKSAKSIPVTHHRLLSPIKSPGFVPTNNVTYIVEAAARIIGQGPHLTSHGKIPSLGSSVPLQIRNLKQRLEAAEKASRFSAASQTPKGPNSNKYIKGQPREKGRIGSRDPQMSNISLPSLRDGSDNYKSKGKSVSLAIQAKVNVQKREGLTSSSTSGSISQKVGDDAVKLGQINKSQINMRKSVQKTTSVSRSPDVLRLNNQKQNCIATKDKGPSKAPLSKQKDQKSRSMNGTVRTNKAIGSTSTSKKMNSVTNDSGKEPYPSNGRKFSQMKQAINRDVHLAESVARKAVISKAERSVHHNVSTGGCMNWDATNCKSTMDVVSFTFTSPITRSMPGSVPSDQVNEKDSHLHVSSHGDPYDSRNSTLASSGLNTIGGDALSVLLEQKLKELSSRVESSHYMLLEAHNGCSSLSLQDSLSTLNVRCTAAVQQDDRFQFNRRRDASSCLHDIESPVDGLLLKAIYKQQALEEIEENSCASTNPEYERELSCGYPSPVSSLEPSFSDGSCDSSNSKTSTISKGSNQSLLSAHETIDRLAPRKHQSGDVDMELSDSASSTFPSLVTNGKNVPPILDSIGPSESSNWELEYVAKILCHAGLNLEDFVLDEGNRLLSLDLFDQLENQKIGSSDNMDECIKIGRKVLFDCVGECLEQRCKWLSSGSSKAWHKWTTLFKRNGWLAQELYKEISGWISMGDLMVDELVDKDMSSWHGRWVEFEIEAFEQVTDIEKAILTSLVDELVADFLSTETAPEMASSCFNLVYSI